MSKAVKQKHHIVYAADKGKQGDWLVTLYKGEHWVVTQLQRRKRISKGLLQALKYWILRNEANAVDLED